MDHLERRETFESFFDSIARCLDLTWNRRPEADERLGEVSGSLPKASMIAQWRESSDLNWSIETNLRQVFPHLFANLKWSFYSIMHHEIFEKNLRSRVFLARVTSSVYCSMGRSPKLHQVFSHLPSGVFVHAGPEIFQKKTWNEGFCARVTSVFIVLCRNLHTTYEITSMRQHG